MLITLGKSQKVISRAQWIFLELQKIGIFPQWSRLYPPPPPSVLGQIRKELFFGFPYQIYKCLLIGMTNILSYQYYIKQKSCGFFQLGVIIFFYVYLYYTAINVCITKTNYRMRGLYNQSCGSRSSYFEQLWICLFLMDPDYRDLYNTDRFFFYWPKLQGSEYI